MPYLVSFALLVAVISWMVGVYNNLEHLRGVVCHCWSQWRRVTHQRNQCLADFVVAYTSYLPGHESQVRELMRLREDSERSLALALEPRWGSVPGFVGGAEQLLRLAVARSVQVIDTLPPVPEHEYLQRVCSEISVSLYRQDQVASLFNHAAVEYNAALRGVSARLLAPIFGFCKANPLDLRNEKTPAARS